MLVLLNTRLHSVHFMLALQLAWLCKVYQKPKIFFAFRALHVGSLTLLASQSLVQTRNPFLHIVQSMVGLWLAWWCFNNVCIKFHGSHVKSPTCLTLQSNLGILPFPHKQIITQFSFFIHKNCTLLKIASRSNALRSPLFS